jgi:RND family efflux transporter MFP subunit
MTRREVCALFLLAACGGERTPTETHGPQPAVTNHIELSAETIGSLGITFAKVERGRLQRTLEVPGQLAVPAERRWTIRAPADGRLALAVARWAKVETGEMVGDLLSPSLGDIQRALFATHNEREQIGATLAAQRALTEPLAARARALAAAVAAAEQRRADSEALAEQAAAVADEAGRRAAELERALGDGALSQRELLEARRAHAQARETALAAAMRRDELRASVADLRLEAARAQALLPTHASEIAVLERRAESAALELRQRLRELGTLTSLGEAELGTQTAGKPRWQTLEALPLHAPGGGQVTALAGRSGEWLAAGAPILEIVDARELLFRGHLPEGDLARIPPGASVSIDVGGGAAPIESKLRGPLPIADEVARTVLVEAPLDNADLRLPAGLSAIARVRLATSANEETLAPAACVVRDGLEWIVFRRDPAQPDRVTRLPVEIGERSGDRVVVLAGLMAGDEIVAAGAHQLRNAGVGRAPPGGHFHADGTWHPDHK